MNEDTIPDYSEFKETVPLVGGNLMTALSSLADQKEAADKEVKRLEELLTEAKNNQRRIIEDEIPKLLDGLEGKINLPDGRTVEVGEKIRANIGGDKKPLALHWLNSNGHGSLIKRRFIVEFGRDQEELVKEFESKLEDSKTMLNVKREYNVQWQTLDAFVREQLENGDELPLDIFGVYRQRFAKIKS